MNKPKDFIISDLKWKFLIRNILSNKNQMIAGPSGFGKTLLTQKAAKILSDKFNFFLIPMGSAQDPRSTLIGNTHFDKNKGTFFVDSKFVKAIQTKNSIIVLDDLNREHPEASNILLSVLDYNQRCLTIDEDPKTPVINVAKNVSFIATSNFGLQYTGTKVIDRALLDRFLMFDVDLPSIDEEHNLLKIKFPSTNSDQLLNLVKIAQLTRENIKSNDPRLSNIISVRETVELAEMLNDGFTFNEISDLIILPMFSDEGGPDSERIFVKQIIQKFIPTTKTNESIFKKIKPF
jgi:MoxR-like ATPase